MMNSNRERKRILLVEDEEDARELAAFTLAEYTVICARGFDEGLFAARRGYFDLYILDNWLPSGSGVDMCCLIRKFDPHTPILFCSATAYVRDIREATLAGAGDYLIKPVIPNELRQAVAKLISVAPVVAKRNQAGCGCEFGYERKSRSKCPGYVAVYDGSLV